jgi:hypothetical protein
LPGAWAGTEVGSVRKNVLENLEQIDKSPPKNVRKPGTPKRGAKARSACCCLMQCNLVLQASARLARGD